MQKIHTKKKQTNISKRPKIIEEKKTKTQQQKTPKCDISAKKRRENPKNRSKKGGGFHSVGATIVDRCSVSLMQFSKIYIPSEDDKKS